MANKLYKQAIRERVIEIFCVNKYVKSLLEIIKSKPVVHLA